MPSQSFQSLLKVINGVIVGHWGLVKLCLISSKIKLILRYRWNFHVWVVYWWLSRHDWLTHCDICSCFSGRSISLELLWWCHRRNLRLHLLWILRSHWHTSLWRLHLRLLWNVLRNISAWRWSSESLVEAVLWWGLLDLRIVSWHLCLVVISITLIEWVLKTFSIKIAV